MSLKKKVVISTIVYGYLVALLAVIGLFNSSRALIILLCFIGLFTVVYLIFIRSSIKNERKARAMLKQHPINDMVNGLDDFKVTFKEEYAINQQPKVYKPRETKQVEVKPTETQSKETKVEEVKEEVLEYVDSEFELKDDKVEYANDIDFGVLCNNFNEYALKNGLIIEQASIRLLISSICASKLVFLRSARMDLLPKVVKVLNSFLGNEDFMFDVNTIEKNSLVWKVTNGKYVHTDFIRALHQAKKYRKHLNVIALNNVNVETMNDYFSEFYQYCKAPNVACNINMGKDKQAFTMPKNITFVVIPDSFDYLDKISKDLAVNSFSIEIQVRENELIRDAEVHVKRYPYQNYMATIEFEKQNLRLSEETWKKLDDFEETLALEGKFRVENKTVLQIESFVCAMLACGADDIEAFDASLATKIVPTIKSYTLYKPGKVDNVISAAVERHFELDSIPTTLRALKKNN